MKKGACDITVVGRPTYGIAFKPSTAQFCRCTSAIRALVNPAAVNGLLGGMAGRVIFTVLECSNSQWGAEHQP